MQFASSFLFAHHQEEAADIAVAVKVVPVVAVQAVLVEVAGNQPIAILVDMYGEPSMAPLLDCSLS